MILRVSDIRPTACKSRRALSLADARLHPPPAPLQDRSQLDVLRTMKRSIDTRCRVTTPERARRTTVVTKGGLPLPHHVLSLKVCTAVGRRSVMAHLAAVAPAACVARDTTRSLSSPRVQNLRSISGSSHGSSSSSATTNTTAAIVSPLSTPRRRHTRARRTSTTATSASTSAATASSAPAKKGAGWVSDDLPDEVDVCIIGAGIGGLSCAALLGKYGLSVAVAEAHYVAGGAAHSFHRGGGGCKPRRVHPVAKSARFHPTIEPI